MRSAARSRAATSTSPVVPAWSAIDSTALSGLIAEESGRLAIRLTPIAPPDDPARPWRSPAAVRAAFRWEPARAATLRPNELAAEVLTAFRRAIEDLGHA